MSECQSVLFTLAELEHTENSRALATGPISPEPRSSVLPAKRHPPSFGFLPLQAPGDLQTLREMCMALLLAFTPTRETLVCLHSHDFPFHANLFTDIVGNNIPVFFIQDAIKFPDLIHAVKPKADREIPQAATGHDSGTLSRTKTHGRSS